MNKQNHFTNQAVTQGCSASVPEGIMTAGRCELTDIKLHIEGTLPEDIQGHVFIVGPVGSVTSGGLPYTDGDSLLNGDGMIYRLDFDQKGEVGFKSRIVTPPCFWADKATRPGTKYDKYRFRNHGLIRFSFALGARNQLNTAFVPIKFPDDSYERLLVTYDVGRPYEIDTETLEVVTPIGSNLEWHPAATGFNFPFQPVFSTAHPVFDRHSHELFTVNYGRSISSFLATIPFIYDINELPQEVDEILESIASFIEDQDVVKDFFKIFSQFSDNIWQFSFSLIERLLNIDIHNFVYLIRWDGTEQLERWKLVLPDGSPVKMQQTMHQIGVTKDYVILMDTAFKTGLEQLFQNPFPDNKGAERFLSQLLTRPVSPDSTIYIVRRADLKAGQRPACSQTEVEVVARQLVIPLECAHFLVDYENPNGQITLHASHICAWDVAEWVRKYSRSAYKPYNSAPSRLGGMEINQVDINRMGRYVIDAENAQVIKSQIICDSELTWGVGLYAYSENQHQGHLEHIYWTSFGLWKELLTKLVFDLYKNYKYRAVEVAEILRLTEKGIPANLFHLHTSSKSLQIIDQYKFPPGYTVSSPQFIPRPDGEDSPTNGYIVCAVVFNQTNEFWIFDAKNLAEPLCKLSHPLLNFGYTLHSTWLPKIAPRTAKYHIPVRQDYQNLVKRQPQEIQNMFEEEVYPHFE